MDVLTQAYTHALAEQKRQNMNKLSLLTDNQMDLRYRPRGESWTEEMRQLARERAIEQFGKKKAECQQQENAE